MNPQMDMNQPMNNMNPQMGMNQSMNNMGPQPNMKSPQDKNKLYIIIGAVALVVIIVVLLLTVFKKDSNDIEKDYEDYVKEQEKEYEKLNKNFTTKEYKIKDGLLIILDNKNDKVVDAKYSVEFYDEAGTIVDVVEDYSFYIPASGKGYAEARLYDKKFSTYKVTAKLDESPTQKTYNDKVKVTTQNTIEDEIIFQVKNESDKKLSVDIGVLFFAEGDVLIAYEEEFIDDLESGETASEKVYIPDDEDYNPIKYSRVEYVVTSAIYK